jgi:hypothetical protein
MAGRQAPSHHNFYGRPQSSGANAVPLGPRRSTRLQGMQIATDSRIPGPGSRDNDEAADNTFVRARRSDDASPLVSLAHDTEAHVEVADTTPLALEIDRDIHEPRNKREREPEPSTTPSKRTRT